MINYGIIFTKHFCDIKLFRIFAHNGYINTRNMRTLFTIFLFTICTALTVKAQSADGSTLPVKEPVADEATASEVKASSPFLLQSVHTGFSYSNRFGSATWINPSFASRISDRFSLTVGFSIVNADRLMWNVEKRPEIESEVIIKRKNVTSSYITAEGRYIVNPKLLISGTIVREMTNFSQTGAKPEQLLSFGMEYKISENLSFGIQVTHIQNGYGYYSPFGYGYMPGLSPFYQPF